MKNNFQIYVERSQSKKGNLIVFDLPQSRNHVTCAQNLPRLCFDHPRIRARVCDRMQKTRNGASYSGEKGEETPSIASEPYLALFNGFSVYISFPLPSLSRKRTNSQHVPKKETHTYMYTPISIYIARGQLKLSDQPAVRHQRGPSINLTTVSSSFFPSLPPLVPFLFHSDPHASAYLHIRRRHFIGHCRDCRRRQTRAREREAR